MGLAAFLPRPVSSIATWPRKFAAALTGAAVSFLPLDAASAQGRSVPIVRDAEIEALVSDYAAPILKAAGLNSRGIQIVLVNNNSFNAFVDGRRIFINTGTLLQAETPNEVIGVIAHESGHLAGGHQQRLREQLESAQNMAVIGMLLGIGATAAGAAAGNSSVAGAGGGLALGGTEMAMRNLLSYQRSEEVTADRSAITYLDRTGQSARGMLATFERFANALALTGTRVDPYRISHPLPRERIANLETLAHASPNFDKKDPPALQLRHDLMRAKIAAYTGNQSAIAGLARKDPRGLAVRYGDAISTYLNGSARAAVPKIDALIKEQPNNPYFHEIKGEILLKMNDAAGAAKAFQRASQLDPRKSSLIRMSYGRALMLTGSKSNMPTAVRELKAGIARDPDFAQGYQYLAQAYGQMGDIGQAELATADMHYYSGNIQEAKIFALRAQQKLKRGSPEWVRAQDIINSKSSKKKRS
ncbi:M48 family metalloprotease [Brucella sp. IR073]|uniref:M48 family metalloprotease n=1 Tax=unclassified Brucella TaxID=2632610 RepID=UPI003B97EE6A